MFFEKGVTVNKLKSFHHDRRVLRAHYAHGPVFDDAHNARRTTPANRAHYAHGRYLMSRTRRDVQHPCSVRIMRMGDI